LFDSTIEISQAQKIIFNLKYSFSPPIFCPLDSGAWGGRTIPPPSPNYASGHKKHDCLHIHDEWKKIMNM